MITYDPFWKTLKRQNISQYALIKHYGVSTGQLARLRANCNVSTYTLNKLCNILNCDIIDIIAYRKD